MDRAVGKKYERHYTWSHPIGERVIAHTDGAVSLMIAWDGVDVAMQDAQERLSTWSGFYRLLGSLDERFVAEFHLWREYDEAQAARYLAHGEKMVRGQALGGALRRAHGELLAQYAMKNTVAVVLTALPVSGFFLGAKRALKQQARLANVLEAKAAQLIEQLPGGELVSVQQYLTRIQQSYSRDAYLRDAQVKVDRRFLLAEQMVREAPVVIDRTVRLGDQCTKVLLVYLYPEAEPGWCLGLSALSVTLHISHIVWPAHTKAAMNQAERESDLIDGTLSRRGRDYAIKGMSDLQAFRAEVAEHDLEIYKNAYLIHLHGDVQSVQQGAQAIEAMIEKAGGQVRGADYIQLPYFRVGQPGQGYRCPLFRPDHTWQVADMLPVQVYSEGEREAIESLRLGSAGELIGFNLSEQSVAHSFTVAMTGAGKGVEKVATIAETYPLGVDWYIVEIGPTYQWLVEGFGGTYTSVDPDHTVVNPLPSFAMAATDGELPLDTQLAGGTVQALAFLLSDGNTFLDVHSDAAAQMALQMLYARGPLGPCEAPTLEDYLVELEGAQYFDNDKQALAARAMADNLNSFLSTTAGRVFIKQDNLNLSPGISGVDLKAVGKASPSLLKFYLVFLSLKMAQMAFYQNTSPARVLLDEMHEFVRISPEVVGALIKGIARMGRKENAAIDLVTQGIEEIDVIEKTVIDSMPNRTLLYRAKGWEEIAERIAMPDAALDHWKGFPYPLELAYRPALRSQGTQYYPLHLIFPELLLDIADTRPETLALKKRIAREVRDPFVRLTQLRNALGKGAKHCA